MESCEYELHFEEPNEPLNSTTTTNYTTETTITNRTTEATTANDTTFERKSGSPPKNNSFSLDNILTKVSKFLDLSNALETFFLNFVLCQ